MEHPTSNFIVASLFDAANAQILGLGGNKSEPTLSERRIMIDSLLYYKQYFAKWDDDLHGDYHGDYHDDSSSDDEIYKMTHAPAPVKQSPTSQIENAITDLEEGVPYEDIHRAYGGVLALAFATVIKTVRNGRKPMKNEDLTTLNRFGYFDEHPTIQEFLE